MPRTVLVLGGGGATGAYQVGCLLALADAGVVPDALVGCSAGALNAAFLAREPGLGGAGELARWWASPEAGRSLVPGAAARARALAGALTGRTDALLDPRPLRRLVDAHVGAHDVSELAVPLTVTTACLDCGAARHHDRGPLADVLLASCSLPGLFPPVRLPDGHLHVDGGVVCGVPIAPALDAAGPDDVVLVLDCGLSAVTGTAGRCAGMAATDDACGLGAPSRTWTPVEERRRGALDVVLRSFTLARAVANRASVEPFLADPRVRVLPHVADAWATGLLPDAPSGPRDLRRTADLLRAGRAATARWLDAVPVPIV